MAVLRNTDALRALLRLALERRGQMTPARSNAVDAGQSQIGRGLVEQDTLPEVGRVVTADESVEERLAEVRCACSVRSAYFLDPAEGAMREQIADVQRRIRSTQEVEIHQSRSVVRDQQLAVVKVPVAQSRAGIGKLVGERGQSFALPLRRRRRVIGDFRANGEPAVEHGQFVVVRVM